MTQCTLPHHLPGDAGANSSWMLRVWQLLCWVSSLYRSRPLSRFEADAVLLPLAYSMENMSNDPFVNMCYKRLPLTLECSSCTSVSRLFAFRSRFLFKALLLPSCSRKFWSSPSSCATWQIGTRMKKTSRQISVPTLTPHLIVKRKADDFWSEIQLSHSIWRQHIDNLHK